MWAELWPTDKIIIAQVKLTKMGTDREEIHVASRPEYRTGPLAIKGWVSDSWLPHGDP